MRRLTVHPDGWTCSECGMFTWLSDPYHHLAIHRDLSRVNIDIHLEVFVSGLPMPWLPGEPSAAQRQPKSGSA